MTSLSEAYGGRTGTDLPPRRLALGAGLFSLGALLVLLGIAAATTDLLVETDGNLTAARRYGGILGGVGVPAVLLGVSTVLPASRRTRAAAMAGAGVSAAGVALFARAYPCQWSGSNCGAGLADLTLPTVGIYSLGVLGTLWCLFVGVATFKRRNDPGGTATVQVTRAGETRVIEAPTPASGLGGVGLLGGRPDGEAPARTDRGGDPGAVEGGASPAGVDPAADAATDAEIIDDGDGETPPAAADAYCGTCAQFRYARTADGLVPYCGLREEPMDGMDACEEWTGRGRR